METLSLRLETSLVKRIEEDMKDFHYSTKTEFIREAIRAKCGALEEERGKKLVDATEHGKSANKAEVHSSLNEEKRFKGIS